MENSDLDKVIETFRAVGIYHEVVTSEMTAEQVLESGETDTLANVAQACGAPRGLALAVGTVVLMAGNTAVFFGPGGAYIGLVNDGGDGSFYRRGESRLPFYATPEPGR